MSERTALYRLYDAADVLLYIGITASFGVRWDQHARAQAWWPKVDHQTVKWLADRDQALAAEKAAIKAEHPRHNITHNVDAETGLPMTKLIASNDWRTTGRIGRTELRSDLTYVIDQVVRQHSCIFITARWTPCAAIVTAELGEAIRAAGGAEAALRLLRPDHAVHPEKAA